MGGQLGREEHETSHILDSEDINDGEMGPSASVDITAKLKSLLGNTEKLSASAQKLFAMGKLYVTGKAGDRTRSDGFPALFQALPENELAGQDHYKDKETTSNHTVNHRHSLGESSTVFSPDKSVASVHQLPDKKDFSFSAQSLSLHCTQTYVQWKASHDLSNLNFLCFPPSKTMYIQPLDGFPDICAKFQLHTNTVTLGFFDMLQGFLQLFFSGMEVAVLPPISINQTGWKVRSRFHPVTKQKQYCVTDIFPLLRTLLPSNGNAIVGMSWTDLYPENFNFVLGEASYAHKSAVISFGRYEPNNFDDASHQDVTEINGQVIWKLLRTLSHEVCHLFGLSHCVFFRCAMNESSSVSQALSQPLFLCPVCLRKLQQACGFDVLERYQFLSKFMQNINNQFSESVQIQDSVAWLENCIDYLAS